MAALGPCVDSHFPAYCCSLNNLVLERGAVKLGRPVGENQLVPHSVFAGRQEHRSDVGSPSAQLHPFGKAAPSKPVPLGVQRGQGCPLLTSVMVQRPPSVQLVRGMKFQSAVQIPNIKRL